MRLTGGSILIYDGAMMIVLASTFFMTSLWATEFLFPIFGRSTNKKKSGRLVLPTKEQVKFAFISTLVASPLIYFIVHYVFR